MVLGQQIIFSIILAHLEHWCILEFWCICHFFFVFRCFLYYANIENLEEKR